MKTDLTKHNHGRQSHILVNAPYALKKNEIDIVLTLITAITKEDEDFKDYQFTIKELEEKTNRKWQSKQLESTITALLSKPIKLPKEESRRGFEYTPWFSYFNYDDSGLITCRFDKALKPHLIKLTGTRVLSDFRHILPMKSTYLKRMYLLLKEYNKIGKRTFNIEELQTILKVPKSMKRYDNFKRLVLKKAEADINKFSDLEVKLSEKKRLRRVVEITYTIRKNTTDLKTFIEVVRELYTNRILHYSKDNRPIKCNKKGYLYYGDEEKSYIDAKEAQKLWEYLHEKRGELYVFEENMKEEKEYAFLSSMSFFQTYIKENFTYKKIIDVKKGNEVITVSIFPNGNLFDMSSGNSFDSENIDKIWKIVYSLAKKGELKVLINS